LCSIYVHLWPKSERRTVIKWATGVLAIVFVGVGTWFAFSLWVSCRWKKGEKHRPPIPGGVGVGRWDFGDQPTLFAVAQGT